MPLDDREHSASLTAVFVPDGYDADEVRRLILDRYDVSLGAGLGRLTGRVFRIGHLGDLNDVWLAGALAGVEMGLTGAGVPIRPGGVQAAIDHLAATRGRTRGRRGGGVSATAGAASAGIADPRELQAALERDLEGEVRVDAYTRHLYAQDASLYAIEPLGGRLPARRGRRRRRGRACAARLGVPVARPRRRHEPRRADGRRPRARARPLAPHERDRARSTRARAARACSPASCRTTSTAPPRAHGLAFGPDTSTVEPGDARRHDRQQLRRAASRSSTGRRSTTCSELEVVLADGSRARLGRCRATRRRGAAPRTRSRARSTAGCPGSSTATRDAIAEDYPRTGASRAATGSTGWRRAFDLAQARRRLRGHARGRHRGRRSRSCRAAEARRCSRSGTSTSVAEAIAATDDALALRRRRGRADRPHDPRPLAPQARVPRARPTSLEGDPDALLFVDASPATTRTRSPRRLDALEARGREHGHGYHTLRARDRGRAGRADQGPQGRARAADGGERGRAPAGRVRRGHRRRARAPRRVRRALRRRSSTATGSRPASTATARSAACTSGRSSTSRGPAASRRCATVAERGRRAGRRVTTASTPPSTATGASAAPFNPRDVRRRALRRDARGQARCSTRTGVLNPGVMVDAEPMTDAPARPRAAARAAAAHDALRVRRRRCARAADRCQRIGACRKTGTRRHVPVLHGHARGGARHARARERARARRSREPDPHAALGDERLHEILDLCLECKACKSECPLSVDMATLKSEFLSHYQAHPRHAAALAAVRRDPAR